MLACRNCYLPHLFKYLLAKLIGATKTSDISAIALNSTVFGSGSSSSGIDSSNSSSSNESEQKPSQFSLTSDSIRILQQNWELLLDEMNPTMKADSPDVYRIASRLCESILHLSGSGWSDATESGSVGSTYTDQSASMTVAEAELLRDYYKTIGQTVLDSHPLPI